MVAGLEVTARCLVFVCQGEGEGAVGLLQARASLGVLSWWCRRGKGGAALARHTRGGGSREGEVAARRPDRRRKKGEGKRRGKEKGEKGKEKGERKKEKGK
jgi:hypothetical protein